CPVPRARTSATGLSSFIRMPSSNSTFGLCSVRSARTRSAWSRSFTIVDWMTSVPGLRAVLHAEACLRCGGGDDLPEYLREEPGRSRVITLDERHDHEADWGVRRALRRRHFDCWLGWHR